jgi:integral membrane protein
MGGVFAMSEPDPAQIRSALNRLRLVSMLEGMSLLLLLGIAMPLKYAWDMPQAVSWVGLIHGLLFLFFLAILFNTWTIALRHPKYPFLMLLASVIPFAPIWTERWLKRQLEGTGTVAP